MDKKIKIGLFVAILVLVLLLFNNSNTSNKSTDITHNKELESQYPVLKNEDYKEADSIEYRSLKHYRSNPEVNKNLSNFHGILRASIQDPGDFVCGYNSEFAEYHLYYRSFNFYDSEEGNGKKFIYIAQCEDDYFVYDSFSPDGQFNQDPGRVYGPFEK